MFKKIFHWIKSLPRPFFYFEKPREGIRFPQDCTRRELVDLIYYHHNEHVKYKSKSSDLQEKLIKVQKELSRLKRNNK